MKIFLIIFIGLILLNSCKMTNKENLINNNSKIYINDTNILVAKLLLERTLKDTSQQCFIKTEKTNIEDTQMLVYAVEPILFNKYGVNDIKKERPYQICRIDNFWIMTGSLENDNNSKTLLYGGTFELILNSKNGNIISLTHGK